MPHTGEKPDLFNSERGITPAVVEEFVFQPERRTGFIVQLTGMLIILLTGVFGVYRASFADIGPVFVIFLLPSLLALVLLPALAYRVYALRGALYVLEREGLHLRWGLRVEEIPIAQILWVRRIQEFKVRPPLPRLRWPGAVLGVRRWSGGVVEYLADDIDRLVLVATEGRTYGLSPANPETFVMAFERCIEMGSLTPIAPRSVYPTVLLNRVWSSTAARTLLIVAAALSLVLILWVSILVPLRSEITLGNRPGYPGDAVPAVRLMLLPVLSLMFVAVDFFAGLFFFRREETQALAYLLWGAAALTPLPFMAAVFFILRAGPV